MGKGTSPAGKRPSLLGRLVDRSAGRRAGLPPARTSYTVARGVRIPMSDGCRLAADLYLPDSEAVGTLLVRSPYGRWLPLAMPFARLFAGHGFNALFVSSRGTFGSDGTFSPMATEVEDGRDVVIWMRDQSWFTGTFATLGASYLGFTQWALLVDPPEEMVTAVVSVGPHDFSRHVWGTGAFRLDFLSWSKMVADQEQGGPLRRMVAMAAAKRRGARAMDGLPLADAGQAYLGDRGSWYRDWVTRPDLGDPFWKTAQLGDALDRAGIPILLLTGWQDLFLGQTLEQYRRLHERGVEVELTVGPWTHLTVGTGRDGSTTRQTYDWLVRHFGDAHRDGPDRPQERDPVRYFLTGADEWRSLPAWPPAASPHPAYLAPGGRLDWETPPPDAPPSWFLYDPSDPTPTVGGPMLSPRCQVDDSSLAEREDVLCFTSAPLESDLEVVGTPVLDLAHSSDNPHVDVFARISEVDASGRSHNLTEGYVRLDSDREPGPVVLELRPLAHRFAAGTCIRLLVAGGSHPQFSRNLGTGENPGTGQRMLPCRHTVSHGAGAGGLSCVYLPVVEPGGPAAPRRAASG